MELKETIRMCSLDNFTKIHNVGADSDRYPSSGVTVAISPDRKNGKTCLVLDWEKPSTRKTGPWENDHVGPFRAKNAEKFKKTARGN